MVAVGRQDVPKHEKTRVSVTMTTPYILALDTLVTDGLYLNRGEAILEALRGFLDKKQVEPFYNCEEIKEELVEETPKEEEELVKEIDEELKTNKNLVTA